MLLISLVLMMSDILFNQDPRFLLPENKSEHDMVKTKSNKVVEKILLYCLHKMFVFLYLPLENAVHNSPALI